MPLTSLVAVLPARLPEGFRHFVTSMPAPVASGWSGCRAGLAPAGKRRLCTAHTLDVDLLEAHRDRRTNAREGVDLGYQRWPDTDSPSSAMKNY